jgi:hypothetical protein
MSIVPPKNRKIRVGGPRFHLFVVVVELKRLKQSHLLTFSFKKNLKNLKKRKKELPVPKRRLIVRLGPVSALLSPYLALWGGGSRCMSKTAK